MAEFGLKIELISRVVLTEKAATVGEHRTLTRIPGATLLGACAAQGYDETIAFHLYHSGTVRYGDGLPAYQDPNTQAWHQCLPAPLSLHQPKGPSKAQGTNFPPNPGQLKQVREGYVGPDGRLIKIQTGYTMRTDVDADGRAQDGLLYGMQYLEAGQVFLAVIQSDDPQLLGIVKGRLADCELRLGRSRSAEFGRVKTSVVELGSWPQQASEKDSTKNEVIIWCRSDLALRDAETGAPKLYPAAADFGLPSSYSLDPKRSFLRSRRWSPFNGHRRRHDLERQVIVAGSVLVFEGIQPYDWAQVQNHVAAGVGDYRAEGLGQVLVQPKLLFEKEFGAEANKPRSNTPKLGLPKDPLGRWLERRWKEKAAQQDAWRLALELSQKPEFRKLAASQWQAIRQLAGTSRRASSTDPGANFMTKLKHQIQPEKGGGVTAQRWAGGAKTLLEGLGKIEDPFQQARTAEFLATLMVRRLSQEADHG